MQLLISNREDYSVGWTGAIFFNCYMKQYGIYTRDAEPVDISGSGSRRAKIFGSGSDEVIFFEFFLMFKCFNV